MHPKNLNNFDPTKSERAMFDALEEQLDNSYHVFYSVTWYTEENGVRHPTLLFDIVLDNEVPEDYHIDFEIPKN